jgi:O-antigen ligase
MDAAAAPSAIGRVVFSGLCLLVFLLPLKFGNPVVTQFLQYPPRTMGEWVVLAWLDSWFVCLVCGLLVLSLWDSAPWPLLTRTASGKRRCSLLTATVLLFVVTQLAAVPTSIVIGLSLDTAAVLAVYGGLFLLAARYATSRQRILAIFGALALGTLAVCLYGFDQYFRSFREAPSWELIYRIHGRGPDAARVLQKLQDARVFSTFVYPNTLGGFLVVAFGAAVAALWRWRGRFTTAAFVALVVLVAAAMGFVLVLTKSNGAFLAVGVALLAALILLRAPLQQKMLFGAIVVLVLASAFAVGYGHARISGGLATLGARADYWRAAAQIARDKPLLGWGPGTFGENYVRFIKAEEFSGSAQPEEPRMAHNSFLQMASDSGVVSMLLFAVMWLVGIWRAAVAYRRTVADPPSAIIWLAVFAGLVGWAAHNLVDFDLYIPGVAGVAFVLLGVVENGAHADSEKAADGSRKSFSRTKTAWAVTLLVTISLLGFVAWQARISTANYRFTLAQDARFEGKLPEALRCALDAASRAPRTAYYHAFAGEIYLELGRWEEAERQFDLATKRAPFHASYHYFSAWTRRQRLGAPDDTTVRQLKQAVQCYPANPVFKQALEEAVKSSRLPR